MNLHAILCLVPTPALGGAELSLVSLLERMGRDIFEPLAVVPAKGALAGRS